MILRYYKVALDTILPVFDLLVKRPPSSITVTNLSDNPNSIKEVVPVDFITASANYDTDTQNLTIVATSSDSISTPILSILDLVLVN